MDDSTPRTNPPSGRATDAADASEDGCGERGDPGEEPHRGADRRERQREQHAGHAREHAADHERRDHDRAVDVDAHEARDLLILGDRAHRPSPSCVRATNS